MKKAAGFIVLLIFMTGLIGCSGKTVKLDLPFTADDVESAVKYHFEGVPITAEKKIVTDKDDIKALYERLEGLPLKDKTIDDSGDGGDVTSFRFQLSDGTNYELIYVCSGVKNGYLASQTGGFRYFTRADIGACWNGLNQELVAEPADQSELPEYDPA